MSYKIRKTHKLDNQRIYNFLVSHVDDKNLMKNIKEHIKSETSFKLQDERGEILGVFLAKNFCSYYSLSYFFLDEKVRRKPIVLKFFLYCTSRLNPTLEMYVKKNKNHHLYDRYFERTNDENILLYKGLRDDSLSNDLLKGMMQWVDL